MRLKCLSSASETTTNQPLTSATSSGFEPSNKKLKLLKNLDSDDDGGSEAGSGDTSFRILQETAAYLAPIALTDDEKMSAVLFWKRHCDSYPFLNVIARVY
jgi:hypothetical protein